MGVADNSLEAGFHVRLESSNFSIDALTGSRSHCGMYYGRKWTGTDGIITLQIFHCSVAPRFRRLRLSSALCPRSAREFVAFFLVAFHKFFFQKVFEVSMGTKKKIVKEKQSAGVFDSIADDLGLPPSNVSDDKHKYFKRYHRSTEHSPRRTRRRWRLGRIRWSGKTRESANARSCEKSVISFVWKFSFFFFLKSQHSSVS